MTDMTQAIKAIDNHKLSREILTYILEEKDSKQLEALRSAAEYKKIEHFHNHVYIRGLIELTNYCKNDCYYCGIRRSNKAVKRYRLTENQVLSACKKGYEIGFRTFVLQGGEDAYFSDSTLISIISKIKTNFPDCAITLSLGERSLKSYQALYDAGADRYLLRHETADKNHYNLLHPSDMSYENRIKSLNNLKEIGFQTGAGFMVGSPNQSIDTLLKDLHFIQALKPAMVGIGPFLPASNTPFECEKKGSYIQTLKLIAIVRLLEPRLLIPSTTALGTAKEDGRIQGIRWGANVLMPNLTPPEFRKHYNLYDNKEVTGLESKEDFNKFNRWLHQWGYEATVTRGDFPSWSR